MKSIDIFSDLSIIALTLIHNYKKLSWGFIEGWQIQALAMAYMLRGSGGRK